MFATPNFINSSLISTLSLADLALLVTNCSFVMQVDGMIDEPRKIRNGIISGKITVMKKKGTTLRISNLFL